MLGSEWAAFTGVARPDVRALSWAEILRFHTGPIGSAPLGWAFLVVAALPLLIGRDWRLAWAIRLWTVALGCWLVAWAGGQGWLGFPLPTPEILLAPAAAALALCAALGATAFEIDLPGYAFGWRQFASSLAAVALALGAVPVLAASVGGRWHMPDQDYGDFLAWLPAQREAGSFRVLWIGDPAVLPLDGWRLDDGLAYGTSREGTPDATDLWPGSSEGATRLLADAVTVARRGQTTRLGHLLAPMAVRYVALPVRLAPGSHAGPISPIPPDLDLAFDRQLDPKLVESDPAVSVFENVAWAPARAVVPPAAVDGLSQPGVDAAATTDLSASRPVLQDQSAPTSFKGDLNADDVVLFSEGSSPRWRLKVGGDEVPQERAFGWANTYRVGKDGHGSLAFHTPPTRYAAIAVEIALWALAIREIYRQRRRRRLVSRAIEAAELAIEAHAGDAAAAASVEDAMERDLAVDRAGDR